MPKSHSSSRRVRWARLALALLLSCASAAQALEVKFEPVAPGVYAYVGDTGGRTRDNEGLNANIGLVVTANGALLIDSGASYRSAQKIHDAVHRVTPQPVRWVFNTGGQDHRWLGNAYFQAQGAEIMAHADARPDMLNRGNDHLQSLRTVLGDQLDGTVPTLPTRFLKSDTEKISFGGTDVEFHHRGGAHTPGDTMVWLPQQRVLFAGDVVYVDRLLGVLPVSHTGRWLATFAVVEQLNPLHIVPGHGRVSDLARAQADTKAYLLALRGHMRQAVDDLAGLSAAIASFDAGSFMRLDNAAELNPGNASRTYLELERE